MKKIFGCRRSSLALIAILLLAGLGFYVPGAAEGIALAITGIVTAIAGANSWESKSKYNQPNDK